MGKREKVLTDSLPFTSKDNPVRIGCNRSLQHIRDHLVITFVVPLKSTQEKEMSSVDIGVPTPDQIGLVSLKVNS